MNFSVAVTLRVMVKLKGILMLEWLNTLEFEGDYHSASAKNFDLPLLAYFHYFLYFSY